MANKRNDLIYWAFIYKIDNMVFFSAHRSPTPLFQFRSHLLASFFMIQCEYKGGIIDENEEAFY